MTNHDWTTPGAYLIAPDVHRIPLVLPNDGLRAVNVYVVAGDDGLTCIDGGWALEASRKQLDESLREIGFKPSDITSFLVTHVHRDHYTQASALRNEFGRAKITLGLADRPAIDWVHEGTQNVSVLERLEAGGALDLAITWRENVNRQYLDPAVWGYPDEWLSGDTSVTAGRRTLDALATPGHTAGHYVFADMADGLLFAGDHVLPTITPTVGFEPRPTGRALTDFLESLAKIRALPDLVVLPAHGATGMSSHERVDQLLEHHRVRLDECRNAVAHGAESAYAVANELRWTRHRRRLDELDPFNQALAVMEAGVHLDLLVATGGLERWSEGAVLHHRLTEKSS